MEKLKAGLIGCGRIGYGFDLDDKRSGIWTHAGAYHASDQVKFVGVYDNNQMVAKRCADKYGVYAYESYHQMVEDLDIISVAVSETEHRRVLEHLHSLCAKSKTPPRVIWVEKPFTGKPLEARYFVDAFMEYDCHIHVNYQRRFCEGFDKLKEYGVPRNIDVTYTRGLLNTASHFVDLMVGLYGLPHRVVAITDNDFVMDFGQFRANFSMLTDISYNICNTNFYYRDFAVEVPPLQTSFKIRKAVESRQYADYRDLSEPEIIELEYEPMLNQVNEIVKSIKTRRYGKLNNGLAVLSVLKGVQDASN